MVAEENSGQGQTPLQTPPQVALERAASSQIAIQLILLFPFAQLFGRKLKRQIKPAIDPA
jgi:hypothetical protein